MNFLQKIKINRKLNKYIKLTTLPRDDYEYNALKNEINDLTNFLLDKINRNEKLSKKEQLFLDKISKLF